MIEAAILNQQKLGHKVQINNGRVFVQGEVAVKIARKLAKEGKIEFTSLGEKTSKGFVFQGVCVIK